MKPLLTLSILLALAACQNDAEKHNSNTGPTTEQAASNPAPEQEAPKSDLALLKPFFDALYKEELGDPSIKSGYTEEDLKNFPDFKEPSLDRAQLTDTVIYYPQLEPFTSEITVTPLLKEDINRDGQQDIVVERLYTGMAGGNNFHWAQHVFLGQPSGGYKHVGGMDRSFFEPVTKQEIHYYELSKPGEGILNGTLTYYKDEDGRCCPSQSAKVKVSVSEKGLSIVK